MLFDFDTPISAQKRRSADGVYPLLRMPLIVGIRGSSQPETIFRFTSSSRRRLLITVYVRFSRANSN